MKPFRAQLVVYMSYIYYGVREIPSLFINEDDYLVTYLLKNFLDYYGMLRQ